MKTLILKLAGPLQSWGDQSRYARRDTRFEPTKSGVLGLLAAAQGRRRTDSVEDLARLRFGVRVDQPGKLQRDFQTAIRWSDRTSMPLSTRYYLADAVFMAGVEGDDSVIDVLADALREPVFPLYLGRRSCPSSEPVFFDVSAEPLEATLKSLDWQARPYHRRTLGKVVELVVHLDAAPTDPDVTQVQDVPVSFDPQRRKYGWRDVRVDTVRVDNPDGHDDLDFMSLLGG